MAYDLCMLAVLAFTTVRGAMKGVAWQLAAIAALVLCFLFATPLSVVVAPLIHVDPPLNRWIAMLAIYLVFSFGCFAAARAVRSGLESMKFEDYDKHLGALFGLLKGATFCVVVTFFSVCLSERACDYVLRTYSGYASAVILNQLQPVMPTELAGVLRPYLNHIADEVREIAEEDSSDDERGPGDWETADGRESPSGFRGSSRPADDMFEDRDDFRPPRHDDDHIPDNDKSVSNPGDSGSLLDAVKRLPEILGDKLKEKVSESIRDALPGSSNRDARDDDKPQPRRNPAAPSPERLKTVTSEIGRMFSRHDDQQQKFSAEIDALLEGVPHDVSLAALHDWRADLLGREPDPDPETDVRTTLDGRLLRQLDAAGIRLSELPKRVASRLEKAGGE